MVLLLLLTDWLPLSHVASPFYYHHHTPTFQTIHPEPSAQVSSHFIYPQRHSSSGHRHPLHPTILAHFLPAQHTAASTSASPPSLSLSTNTYPTLPLSSHTYPTLSLSLPILIRLSLSHPISSVPPTKSSEPNPTLPPFAAPTPSIHHVHLFHVFRPQEPTPPPSPPPPAKYSYSTDYATASSKPANPPPPNSAHRTESSNAIQKQYGFTVLNERGEGFGNMDLAGCARKT